MKTLEQKIEEQKRILESGNINDLIDYAFSRMLEKGGREAMERALDKLIPKTN